MKASDFKIGQLFKFTVGEWRVTDVGSRIIVAIRIDQVCPTTLNKDGTKTTRTLNFMQARDEGWFNGPPYAVAEVVFDEYDLEGIEDLPSDVI